MGKYLSGTFKRKKTWKKKPKPTNLLYFLLSHSQSCQTITWKITRRSAWALAFATARLPVEKLLAEAEATGRDGRTAAEDCHVLRWAKHPRGNSKQMWKCCSANANAPRERAQGCEGGWEKKKKKHPSQIFLLETCMQTLGNSGRIACTCLRKGFCRNYPRPHPKWFVC